MSIKTFTRNEAMAQTFSTYAITLYFDRDSTEKIRTLTAELAGVTENDYMVRNSVPPHLTLGMFHAEDDQEEKIKGLFKDFAGLAAKDVMTDGKLEVDFSGVESFLDKVIFIKPEKNGVLCKLNRTLHDVFLERFEPADNRNYLPENWYPHIALAVKLTHDQFERGMEFLNASALPKKAPVISLGLAICNPYTSLKEVNF